MGFKKLLPPLTPHPISCDIHTRHSCLTKGRMRHSFRRQRWHQRGAVERHVEYFWKEGRSWQFVRCLPDPTYLGHAAAPPPPWKPD